jgi:hypothetical protein
MSFGDSNKLPSKPIMLDSQEIQPFDDLVLPFRKLEAYEEQSPAPRSMLNPSHSPNIFYPTNTFAYMNNGLSNNEKSNNSQASFGLAPFAMQNRYQDEYNLYYDSHFGNSSHPAFRDTSNPIAEPVDNYTDCTLNLMWSHDPTKVNKQKLFTPNEPFQAKPQFGQGYGTATFFNEEEEMIGFSEDIYKMGQNKKEGKKAAGNAYPQEGIESIKAVLGLQNASNMEQNPELKITRGPSMRKGEEMRSMEASTPMSRGILLIFIYGNVLM